MRKRITVLFTVLFILLCGAVTAHANEYRVRLNIDDAIDVPEEGLSIDVCTVMRLPNYAGGGGGSFSYKYYYGGYAANVYRNTSWMSRARFVPDGNQWQTVSIAPGEKSVDVTLERSLAPRAIAYQINSNGCIGSGGESILTFNEDGFTEMSVSYSKSIALKGKVEIPEGYGDRSYKVIAIGETENTNDEYTFNTIGSFLDGETSEEYTLNVKDGMNYTVYVTFNDVFKMQETSVTAAGEDIRLDFTGEVADKITGAIKLPEDFEFVNSENEAIEDVQVEITMQYVEGDEDDAHMYANTTFAKMTPDKRSAEFELYNISEAEDVILFYEQVPADRAGGLFCGGAYADDTRCDINVENAAHLKPSGQNITINMISSHRDGFEVYDKAKVYTLDDDSMYEITAFVRDSKGKWVESYVYTIYNRICEVELPGDCHEYVPAVIYEGTMYYYGKKGFVRNIEDADTVNEYMTHDVDWTGIDPELPIEYSLSEKYNEETGNHTFYIDIQNLSDFDLNNWAIYTVKYDENGLPISMTNDYPRRFLAGTNMHIEKYFTDSNYNDASKIRVFIWDNNNRALCESIELK